MQTAIELERKWFDFPMFAGISRAQLGWLMEVARPLSAARHDWVFRRGENSSCLFILLSGHVKLSIPVERGLEKVVEFLAPGDVFGESSLLPGHAVILDAQALEECELLAFEAQDVQAAIARVPSFAQQLITGLSRRFEAIFKDIESVSVRSAAQRVAEYLLRQPRVGNLAKLPFHKRAIASKLGLQPETFSRSLQHLTAEGLISVRGAKVVIHDPVGLQAILV